MSKLKWRFGQIFVAFPENLNFNKLNEEPTAVSQCNLHWDSHRRWVVWNIVNKQRGTYEQFLGRNFIGLIALGIEIRGAWVIYVALQALGLLK